MIKSLLFTAFILLGATGFAQDQTYSIQFFQNGKPVDFQNGIVTLEKKPFKIEVKLGNLKGIYVNASFTDSIYRLKFSEPVPGWKKFGQRTLEFNDKQALMVSNHGWAYWFYHAKISRSGFDEPVRKIDDQTVIGTKTIKQFSLADHKTITVEKISQAVYLVFMSIEQDYEGNMTKELERTRIKIVWK